MTVATSGLDARQDNELDARREGRRQEGVLLLDKPARMTSHDVVDVVRRKLSLRRVGHAGTLDPLATGLMLLMVGKATKWSDRLTGCDKAYVAVMRCGLQTATGDLEGEVLRQCDPGPPPSAEQFERACATLCGPQEQRPPMYSAVRVNGRRLYEWARRGVEIDRPARGIVIHALQCDAVAWPDVRVTVRCSKGTYVRTLCETLAERLGTCGAVLSLRRTQCGPFLVDAAHAWSQFLDAPPERVSEWLLTDEDFQDL